MKKYEVYEDNAGGLYLCIMGNDGQCERIFENFEYGQAGILCDAISQLEADATAYEEWDGDLVKRIQDDGLNVTAQSLYDNGLGDLIAESGYISSNMGLAGRRALNINEEL